MHWKPKGWTLIGMLLLAVPGAMTAIKVAEAAQATGQNSIATTQVTDTVFRGDGTLANGSVIVSWQAFTAASGQSVPSGSTSATITNGVLSLALVYLQPITTAVPFNSFPMLVGSSLGGSGLNLLYDYENNGAISQDSYILAPTIYGSNAVFTGVQNLVSGFHVLTYVLGTPGRTADQIYIDGVESTSYDPIFHFNAAGLQSSGNLFLGSSNTGIFGTSGLNGTFYRMVTMPTNQLTAVQILQISNQIKNDVASRGVNTSPMKIKQGAPTLHCIGDSITAGLGTSNPYCSLLSLTNQPTYTVDNWGIVGIKLQAINGAESNRVGQLCESSAGPSVALVFLGTNDFLTPRQTPTGLIPNLSGEVQTLKDAGCRVFVGTMLSRSGNDGSGGAYDADKDAYDSLILTNAKAFGADGVVDFAANPLLGADGAASNATFFQADEIHPTQAGQQLLANAASNALNYYFGFNQMNPNVVTAASYTMQAGDGYVTANPTANQTLTLPDCTGQSGAVYTVTNLQSAFTVGVVAGSSSQLINGLAASTVVPVPAHGSLMLRDVPNPKTVSGCHWEM